MSCRKRHRFSTTKSLALRKLAAGAAITVTLTGTLTPAWARPNAETFQLNEAPAERERRASARYKLGASAYREQKYREAVNHFLAADELVPSAALSYNIALAYDKLLESARALSFYRDYLRRSPRGENAAEVGARIRELELKLMQRGVQQLTVRSEPPGALVRIEDEPVGMTPWTGELPPGEHRLTVSLKGYHQGFRKVLLPAANAVDVLVDLAPVPDEVPVSSPPAVPSVAVPPPQSPAVRSVIPHTRAEPSSGSTVVPWLTVGVGAAALAAAGTFELLRSQSESQARSAITQEDYAKRRDQASTYQTTSLVLLGTGGGLVLTGGILLLIGASKDAEPTAARVACSGAGCFGAYTGTF